MTGGEAFNASLATRVLAAAAVTEIALREAAEQVARNTVDKLMLTEHAKGTPTPSAPGDPPSMISGRLKASVTVDPVGVTGEGSFEAKVGPTAEYARIQELGGEAGHGARLPARPYLKPALEESHEAIHAIFIAAWAALGNSLRP
jgi:phage gpG-like protein